MASEQSCIGLPVGSVYQRSHSRPFYYHSHLQAKFWVNKMVVNIQSRMNMCSYFHTYAMQLKRIRRYQILIQAPDTSSWSSPHSQAIWWFSPLLRHCFPDLAPRAISNFLCMNLRDVVLYHIAIALTPDPGPTRTPAHLRYSASPSPFNTRIQTSRCRVQWYCYRRIPVTCKIASDQNFTCNIL
jgi:hypothetical protein